VYHLLDHNLNRLDFLLKWYRKPHQLRRANISFTLGYRPLVLLCPYRPFLSLQRSSTSFHWYLLEAPLGNCSLPKSSIFFSNIHPPCDGRISSRVLEFVLHELDWINVIVFKRFRSISFWLIKNKNRRKVSRSWGPRKRILGGTAPNAGLFLQGEFRQTVLSFKCTWVISTSLDFFSAIFSGYNWNRDFGK